MKKRRFINYGTMFLLSVIVGLFTYKVYNRNLICKYDDVFEEYSEDEYDYLVEIAEKTITERGINTEEIPEDVYYEIVQADNSNTIFKYGLKRHNNGFSDSPEQTIILSKDNRILEKKSADEIKETYIEQCEKSMTTAPRIIGILVWMFCFLTYMVGRGNRESKASKE